MKDLVKLALFALTAAYVALIPQFYEIFRPENRVTMLWDATYHAAIAASHVILAAVFGVAYRLIYLAWRPSARWRVARDMVLVIVLLGLVSRSAVSILDRSGHLRGCLALLDTRAAKAVYYIVLPLLLVLANPFVAKRAVRRLYACLAPMMVISLVWPLTYQTFDVHAPPIPAALATQLASGPTRGTTNVFIFVFDEWSYDRTFPSGLPREDMPRLRQLLGRATLYRDARAPGPTTAVSMPRFLFPDNQRVWNLSYDEIKDLAYHPQAVPGPNLFSASPADAFTMAVGFWIDYPKLLGTNVDFAATIHQEAGTRTFPRMVEALLLSQCSWLRYLGAPELQKPLHPSLVWMFSLAEAHRWAVLAIEHMNEPTFALFHYCIPHYPYVWNERGVLPVLPENPVDHVPANYEANLRYLDRLLGEIVDALDDSGKFETSMLVFTSDHAWRSDPAHAYPDWQKEDANPASELRHVPLIVKVPHQAAAGTNDAPVSTVEIGSMIRSALAQARLGMGRS